MCILHNFFKKRERGRGKFGGWHYISRPRAPNDGGTISKSSPQEEECRGGNRTQSCTDVQIHHEREHKPSYNGSRPASASPLTSQNSKNDTTLKVINCCQKETARDFLIIRLEKEASGLPSADYTHTPISLLSEAQMRDQWKDFLKTSTIATKSGTWTADG